MMLISHRGNTDGKNPSEENRVEYIDRTLGEGFEVEIDIRLVDGKLFLGHDEASYEVEMSWLEVRKERLWIHCKNLDALEFFSLTDFNYFWHDTDDYTLTSKGFIWAYPCKNVSQNSIAVLPEICDTMPENCAGVCSDFVARWL